jgi:hypothetical protein
VGVIEVSALFCVAKFASTVLISLKFPFCAAIRYALTTIFLSVAIIQIIRAIHAGINS